MKRNQLGAALKTILVSCSIATVIAIVTAFYTGEMLFFVAALLFAISGGAGVFVVRSLSQKINGPS